MAIKFDGTGDNITFGDILDFERTDTFSVEFWMKTTTAANDCIIGKFQDNGGTRGWRCETEASAANALDFTLTSTFSTNDIQVSFRTANVNDGVWHHIAWTYTGSSLASGFTMYKDGTSQSLTTVYDNLTATTVNAIALRIGARSATAVLFYTGDLDEVRVWNTTRTAAEIQSNRWKRIAGNETGLVGYWRLDDFGGGNGNVATSAVSFLSTGGTNGTVEGNPLNSDSAPINYGD